MNDNMCEFTPSCHVNVLRHRKKRQLRHLSLCLIVLYGILNLLKWTCFVFLATFFSKPHAWYLIHFFYIMCPIDTFLMHILCNLCWIVYHSIYRITFLYKTKYSGEYKTCMLFSQVGTQNSEEPEELYSTTVFFQKPVLLIPSCPITFFLKNTSRDAPFTASKLNDLQPST